MASTYTYNDLWQVASLQYSRGLENVVWEYATNQAISIMWRAYDWRGTVLPFPPFWLVPGQQDYGKPFYDVPSDFLGLREVYLVEIGANAIPVRRPINVVENLQETHVVNLPTSICYRPSVEAFRIHPAAPYGVASPLYLIDGTYKTRPPKITRSVMTDVLLWDDIYFDAHVKALVSAIYSMKGDVQQAALHKQLAIEAIRETSAVENLELGEPIIHPGEGLMSANFGPFGFTYPF